MEKGRQEPHWGKMYDAFTKVEATDSVSLEELNIRNSLGRMSHENAELL